MNHILHLMDKKTIEVTEQELKDLISNEEDLVFISRIGMTVNKKSISYTSPQNVEQTDSMMDRKNNKTGVLHDGKHVIRHFGQWFMLDGDYKEDGTPLTRPDPEYYPEIARDCVPDPQEYSMKYADIEDKEDRKVAIVGGTEVIKRLEKRSEGFQKINLSNASRHQENSKKGRASTKGEPRDKE